MSDVATTRPTTPASTLAAGLRGLLAPRRVVTILLLVGAWCALWGSISVANVLSGLVVSVVAVLIAGSEPGATRIRFGPLLHFFWLVFLDLIVSTAQVAWEILTPTDYTDEAIIAVDTRIEARSHLLILVVAITVTPGTAVVDADADTGCFYLHVLHAERADQITAHVQRLADLACRGLPVAGDPGTVDEPNGGTSA
jgi:multicomponent Na+:H+ antiporter subunit E